MLNALWVVGMQHVRQSSLPCHEVNGRRHNEDDIDKYLLWFRGINSFSPTENADEIVNHESQHPEKNNCTEVKLV